MAHKLAVIDLLILRVLVKDFIVKQQGLHTGIALKPRINLE